jgi:hypothetical protein
MLLQDEANGLTIKLQALQPRMSVAVHRSAFGPKGDVHSRRRNVGSRWKSGHVADANSGHLLLWLRLILLPPTRSAAQPAPPRPAHRTGWALLVTVWQCGSGSPE